MSEPNGANSREPVNDVAVLEDTNGDGVMDKRTVFADKLVLPRAHQGPRPGRAGRRAAEPLADEGHRRRPQGRHARISSATTTAVRAASIEHNANSLFWAMDNVMYTSEGDFHLRLKNGKIEMLPTLPARAVGRDAWTMPGGCSGTSTTRRSSPTSSRRATTRATRTWSARAASTSRCWPARIRRCGRCARRAASIAAIAISSSVPTTAR